jgi:uncharacterized protein YggE
MKHFVSATLLGLAFFGAASWPELALTPPAVAQEIPMRILTVTGQGSERIPTTKSQVTLGVEVQGQSADEAQAEAAQRSTAVVELLRNRGVERLQTTGIRLSPQYNYQDGQGRLVGYMATNTVSFELPTEAIGSLLDDAVKAGATQIQGINFIATDEAIAAAREVALRKAVSDAQTKANVVLGALNLGAQEIVGIQIDGARGEIPVPLPGRAMVAEANADFSTPVVGGEQLVNASVTLQIRY